MATLGERVKERRENKGWSQEQLAEKVSRRGYKIGQSAIGNIEAERVKNPKCIVQLAAALEVSPTWLQTGLGRLDPSPSSPEKPPPEVFISHSSEPSKELTDLLSKLCEVPEGSTEEKAVTTLLRYYFRKKEHR